MKRAYPSAADKLKARSRDHYDRFPFEFSAAGEDAGEEQSAAFRQFVARYVTPRMRVLDVGCGPGRGLLVLTRAGATAMGCDLSLQSLALAAERTPAAGLAQADALALPVASGTLDAVTSDGVLHHTPDARAGFRELCRVVRRGGMIYIAVYKRWRYYYYLYRYVGAVARRLDRSRAGRMLLRSTLLPLYYAVHLVKSRGRRTWAGTRNLFYDYLITPRASFHSKAEVLGWGEALGLQLVTYESSRGNCHSFMFRKSE